MRVVALQNLRGGGKERLSQTVAAVVRMQPHALHLRGVQVHDARIRLEDNPPVHVGDNGATLTGNERAQARRIAVTVAGNRVEADLLGEHGGRGGQKLPQVRGGGKARIPGRLTAELDSTGGALPRLEGLGFDGHGFERRGQVRRQLRKLHGVEAGEVLLRRQIQQRLIGTLRQNPRTVIATVTQARLQHLQ